MARSKKTDPEQIKKRLEKRERWARLLANEDFKQWRAEFEYRAAWEGRESLRPERSNYERAMTSGILDFIERVFGAMERGSTPEVLKKLRESLEKTDGLNGRAGKHEPGGFAGISAIGSY